MLKSLAIDALRCLLRRRLALRRAKIFLDACFFLEIKI